MITAANKIVFVPLLQGPCGSYFKDFVCIVGPLCVCVFFLRFDSSVFESPTLLALLSLLLVFQEQRMSTVLYVQINSVSDSGSNVLKPMNQAENARVILVPCS